MLIAVAGGALLPIQAVINRSIGSLMPSKLQAALYSFLCGLMAVSLALTAHLSAGAGFPAFLAKMPSSSWYMYCGGGMGALFVSAGIWFVGAIGASVFFVLLVLGQLVGSAGADAVGLLGLPVRPLSLERGAGIVLVFLGALLLQWQPSEQKGDSWQGRVLQRLRAAPVSPLWCRGNEAAGAQLLAVGVPTDATKVTELKNPL